MLLIIATAKWVKSLVSSGGELQCVIFFLCKIGVKLDAKNK